MERLKNYLATILFVLAGNAASAQLHSGADGLYIAAGSVFSADSLALTPGATLNIRNNGIARSNVAVNGSIMQVYEMDTPLHFKGTAGIYYADAALNGNNETGLRLTYLDTASGTYAISATSTVDVSANYVENQYAGEVKLYRLTAISNTTGIPTINSGRGITVYPNPATDVCYVKLDNAPAGNATVSITATDGRLVLRAPVIQGQILAVKMGGLASGIYLLRYNDDATSYTVNLVKE